MAVWSNLFYISLSLCTARVVSQSVQVSPPSETVLKGSDARFTATVQGEWTIMTWHAGERLVLIFSSDNTIVESASEQFSATLCYRNDTTCVNFTIRNVARTEAGEITCSVLGFPVSNTVQLYVQESGTVDIRGGNVTVALNHQVEFQCNISAWYPEPDVGWALNGHPVDSSQYNTTSMLDGDLYHSTSVLNFKAVSNTNVECWANVSTLRDPISSSVFLVIESGTVNIRGGNVTVALNHQVEFQCNIAAWYPEPDVGWALNGAAVDSSQYNTTSMLDGDLYHSTSVLNFKAVSNSTVECWATVSTLSDPISSSVFLVVVPPDWTVLISVVVSIGGFALLVLLIIGIVFCYRRRKEKQSNYNDEMTRRVRTQSELNGMSAPGRKQGHVNAGYLPEGHARGSRSDLFGTSSAQGNVFSISESPSESSHNGYGNLHIGTVHGQSLAKHRHATIV